MAEKALRKFDVPTILRREKFPRASVAAATALQGAGFGEHTVAAGAAVIAGAREVVRYSDRSPRELELIYKPEDGSPCTLGDRNSAAAMRRVFVRLLPGTPIKIEDGERTADTGPIEGTADPLDGTTSYEHGQHFVVVGAQFRRTDTRRPIAAALVHPFAKELLVAERKKGTHLYRLDQRLVVAREGIPQQVSEKRTLKEAVVFIDAISNPQTLDREIELKRMLVRRADGGNVHIRTTGSSLDHQRHLTTGRAHLFVVHAVGGPWDLMELPITEAGGVLLDAQTLEPVTDNTVVAIGGNPHIVDSVKKDIHDIYEGYTGYRPKPAKPKE